MRSHTASLQASLLLSLLAATLFTPVQAAGVFTLAEDQELNLAAVSGASQEGNTPYTNSSDADDPSGPELALGDGEVESDVARPRFRLPSLQDILNSRPIQFLFGTGRRKLSWAAFFIFAGLYKLLMLRRTPSLVQPLYVPPLPPDQLEQRCTLLHQAYPDQPLISCRLNPKRSAQLPCNLLTYLDTCNRCLEDNGFDPDDQAAASFVLPLPSSLSFRTLHDLLTYLEDEFAFDQADEETILIERVARHAHRELTAGQLIAVLEAGQQLGSPQSVIYGIAKQIAQYISDGDLYVTDLGDYPPELRREIAKFLYLTTGLRDQELCEDTNWHLTPEEAALEPERAVLRQRGAKLDAADAELSVIESLNLVCDDPAAVEEIDCRRNNIGPELYDAAPFLPFKSLKLLDLSGNQIRIFSAALPPTLVKLALAGCGLRILADDSLDGLTLLETLFLNHNNLQCLPEKLINYVLYLPKLRHLDLRKAGPLSSHGKPFEIYCCQSPHSQSPDQEGIEIGLKSLLHDECWAQTPPIGEAFGLRTIYSCARTGLTEFPETLAPGRPAYMPGVRERSLPSMLDLSDNKIASLPISVYNLGQLTYLNLSDNEFAHFPARLYSLPKLQELYLAGNCIADFSPLHAPMRELKRLSLADNNLRHFPREIIEYCPNLETLHLEGNDIRELPDDMNRLTKLRRLYLDRNTNLKQLPECIQRMETLMFIGMRGIKLKSKEKDTLKDLAPIYAEVVFSNEGVMTYLNSEPFRYEYNAPIQIQYLSQCKQHIEKIIEFLQGNPSKGKRFCSECATYNIHVTNYVISFEISSYSVEENHVVITVKETGLLEAATERGKKLTRSLNKSKTYTVRLDQLLNDWVDSKENPGPPVMSGLCVIVVERDLTKEIIELVQSIPDYERRPPMC